MSEKIYYHTSVDTAIDLLRPNATYTLINNEMIWNDPRPAPTWEEIYFAIEKIKELEDAINIIPLEEAIYK